MEIGSDNEQLPRIDRNYIVRELKGLFNLESGYFFTLSQMLIQPGLSIRNYLKKERGQHIKPLYFLLFNAFLVVFVSGYLIDPEMQSDAIKFVSYFNADIDLRELVLWKKQHMGYVYLGFGIFMAFWIKLFFRNYEYNIYEIFVALAYILGQGMLIILISLFLAGVLPDGIPKKLALALLSLSYYLYIVFALVQLFDRNKIRNFFKMLLVFMLSGVSFLAFQVVLVLILDKVGWLG